VVAWLQTNVYLTVCVDTCRSLANANRPPPPLQSSMWFQAKTAQTNITNNIFFNGPRAGINFNGMCVACPYSMFFHY
jgi:hypothetical protein